MVFIDSNGGALLLDGWLRTGRKRIKWFEWWFGGSNTGSRAARSSCGPLGV